MAVHGKQLEGFRCPKCGHRSRILSLLKQHKRACALRPVLCCPLCERHFIRSPSLFFTHYFAVSLTFCYVSAFIYFADFFRAWRDFSTGLDWLKGVLRVSTFIESFSGSGLFAGSESRLYFYVKNCKTLWWKKCKIIWKIWSGIFFRPAWYFQARWRLRPIREKIQLLKTLNLYIKNVCLIHGPSSTGV